MRRRTRVLLPLLLALALAVGACTDTASRPEPDADALKRDIAAYLIDAAMHDVRAVLVVLDDRTIVEEYYGTWASESRNVFSVTKSVLSTLVGIAVGEGLLALDDPLRDLLPAYAESMSSEVGATTLEQLLTMTGGFRDTWRSSDGGVFTSPDWVAACLSSADLPAGERFAYSDPGTHLISAALAEVTDRSVLDYAREKLFDPLGIDTEPAAEPLYVAENIAQYESADFAWPVDPQGIHVGSAALKLRPRDMAALGQLYLHDGRADGARLVPESWVREATRAQVPASGAATAYGYLWWVGEADGSAAYFAWGYGGQLVQVVPDHDLVVVVSTDVRDHATVDPFSATYLVDSVIAPAVAVG